MRDSRNDPRPEAVYKTVFAAASSTGSCLHQRCPEHLLQHRLDAADSVVGNLTTRFG